MLDIHETIPERRLPIEQIHDANAREWERFSHFHAGWVRECARKSLSPNHTAWTDDVVQTVILQVLRRTVGKPSAADRDLGKIRAELGLAVRREVRTIRGEATGPDPLRLANDDDEEILDTDEILRTLKGVLQRVRTASHATDAIAWHCFEDRLLRNRPADEIADWYKITIHCVYLNLHTIIDMIFKLLREDYRDQFPDQTELFRKLDEMTWLPEMLQEVSGDALADELKTTDSIKIDADVYFRQKLKEHWPILEKEAGKLSPDLWAWFQAYTQALSLGESPAPPGPDVDRTIAMVDRGFRQSCKSEFGELKLYDHFRLRPDGQGIDPDAVARLCGSFSRESFSHVDSKLSR